MSRRKPSRRWYLCSRCGQRVIARGKGCHGWMHRHRRETYSFVDPRVFAAIVPDGAR